MSKDETLRVAVFFLVLLQALPAALSAVERPNILFIFTDDHASHAISAYGSTINETPNLDRLAAQGMLFRNSFVTNSLCAPSRAVILTGKYSHLNGQMTNRDTFDGSQLTFPKLLRKSGYTTALIGKWHLKSQPTGFDHYEILYGQGSYYNPRMNQNGNEVKHVGYTTDLITDLTLEWLEEGRDKTKPFMLMTQHKAPHGRWEPALRHLEMYDNEDVPEPPTLFYDFSGRWPGFTQAGSSSNELVLNLDLGPTFLEAAGVSHPESIQGRSLVPILKGRAPDNWRSSIYYHYYEGGGHGVPKHEGVRTQNHKLIHFYTLDEWELYDLEKDPAEMQNVANKPAYSEVLRNMRSELEKLRRLYDLPPNRK